MLGQTARSSLDRVSGNTLHIIPMPLSVILDLKRSEIISDLKTKQISSFKTPFTGKISETNGIQCFHEETYPCRPFFCFNIWYIRLELWKRLGNLLEV